MLPASDWSVVGIYSGTYRGVYRGNVPMLVAREGIGRLTLTTAGMPLSSSIMDTKMLIARLASDMRSLLRFAAVNSRACAARYSNDFRYLPRGRKARLTGRNVPKVGRYFQIFGTWGLNLDLNSLTTILAHSTSRPYPSDRTLLL
eukprot:9475332-Pyramimonas_sp.AAC.1